MKKALLVAVFLLVPSTLFAAEFVQQPLFLSKSPVTEGQKVRVYAIVSNDESATFTGTVLIAQDGANLGSTTVSLAVGATQTVSVVWIPNAGLHLITAQLVADDGTVVQQVSQPFTILAPPPPIVTAVVSSSTGTGQEPQNYQSSAQIQQAIENISPAAATDTQPVFTGIDSVRLAAAGALNTQLAQAQQELNESISTSTDSRPGASVWWTFYSYLLIALRFLINNAFAFYIFLVVVIFYLLWRLYKRMSHR